LLVIHGLEYDLMEIKIEVQEKNIKNKFHEYSGRTLESYIKKYQRKFPNIIIQNFSKLERGMRLGKFLKKCGTDIYKNSFLNPYGDKPFCKFSVKMDRFKKISGLYFFEFNDELIYIGMSINLYARFKNGYCNISPYNCYTNGQSTNCKVNSNLNNLFKKGGEVKLYILPLNMARKEIKQHETNLIEDAIDKEYELWNSQHVKK